MLKLNSDLKNEAIAALDGKWGMAAILTFVYLIIAGCLSSIPWIGALVSLLISWPLAYGYTIIFYDLLRERKNIEIACLFDGFKDFGRIWGTGILVTIYTMLWTLLLVIPGIIKGYSYAMTPYLLKDEPELKYNAAIEKSMRMMNGHKMKLFLLDLSFIGWALLCILTLGIGFLFLNPYVVSAKAAFYEDLKAELKDGRNWEESAPASSC